MTVSFQEINPIEIDAQWPQQPFHGFNLDSRKVEAGQIFIALTSYSQPEKTRTFAEAALTNGALAVISETELGVANEWVCSDVRQRMGEWQKRYLQQTDTVKPLRIIAVTGTNGKTTISRLIAELISSQQQRCAVMGTTGNGILPDLTPSTHTTLDALQLQNELHAYAKHGATFASLEASSHGLEQGRLNGCDIEIAVYSNLSRDHLDYHGTLEAYAEAKARLFKFNLLKVAVINLDDAHADLMIKSAKNNPAQPKILTYSLTQNTADYY
ncbi:Mur ligase family protein, partial [Acinetobacter baumannii]